MADDPSPPARKTAAPSGDAVIRREAGRSEIAITTTDRLAGAIHSLTWDGREFIDSVDHGRQLQSAASFDCQPSAGYENAGYGRFWFVAEKVVKWNCVFRYRHEHGNSAGDYRFRMFVAVGTLEDVRRSIAALVEDFSG